MTEFTKANVWETLSRRLSSLSADGFRFNQRGKSFSRQREKGWIETLFVEVIDYKPKYILQPAVNVHVGKVEEIFHRTSGFERRFQQDTPTISFALSRVSPSLNLFRYEATDGSSLENASERILADFRSFALPFFAENNSLEALDRLLNVDPTDDSQFYAMDYLRCAHGLIIGAMVKRPNYDELESLYTERMCRFADGYYLGRFKALLTDLRTSRPMDFIS